MLLPLGRKPATEAIMTIEPGPHTQSTSPAETTKGCTAVLLQLVLGGLHEP